MLWYASFRRGSIFSTFLFYANFCNLAIKRSYDLILFAIEIGMLFDVLNLSAFAYIIIAITIHCPMILSLLTV